MSDKLHDKVDDQSIVYIREANRDFLPEHLKNTTGTLYAVHDPDGTMLAVAEDRSIAFALARRNDLTPVSVH